MTRFLSISETTKVKLDAILIDEIKIFDFFIVVEQNVDAQSI